MEQKREGLRSWRKCSFKVFFDVGDTQYGEGTQLLWFSLSLQGLLWWEVLGDTPLEEKEGAFSLLEGVILRNLCRFPGWVFGFVRRAWPAPFGPLGALAALDFSRDWAGPFRASILIHKGGIRSAFQHRLNYLGGKGGGTVVEHFEEPKATFI